MILDLEISGEFKQLFFSRCMDKVALWNITSLYKALEPLLSVPKHFFLIHVNTVKSTKEKNNWVSWVKRCN